MNITKYIKILLSCLMLSMIVSPSYAASKAMKKAEKKSSKEINNIVTAMSSKLMKDCQQIHKGLAYNFKVCSKAMEETVKHIPNFKQAFFKARKTQYVECHAKNKNNPQNCDVVLSPNSTFYNQIGQFNRNHSRMASAHYEKYYTENLDKLAKLIENKQKDYRHTNLNKQLQEYHVAYPDKHNMMKLCVGQHKHEKNPMLTCEKWWKKTLNFSEKPHEYTHKGFGMLNLFKGEKNETRYGERDLNSTINDCASEHSYCCGTSKKYNARDIKDNTPRNSVSPIRAVKTALKQCESERKSCCGVNQVIDRIKQI